MLSWLMVLVAEEHNLCVKVVWEWLERIILSYDVVSVTTDKWVGSGTNWSLNLRT